MAKGQHLFRYDDKYYCRYCAKFFPKEYVWKIRHCGICKNLREKIRWQPRRNKSENTRIHYQEKRID